LFSLAYETDESYFIGAPSGAGKSVIADLSLIRFLAVSSKTAVFIC